MSLGIQDAYQLIHEGAIALAQVEANGIRVDVDYLDREIKRTEKKIARKERQLKETDEWKAWRSRYGESANIGSRDQLRKVLFEDMGHESEKATTKGNATVDESVLEGIGTPFCKLYIEIAKLQKTLGTYLRGIRRETIDGIARPFYNLHRVKSFRSSSDSFNWQNIPIRDPVMGKMVRRAFVARPGCAIIETDYGGIEVRVSACYHKDPTMLNYIHDPTSDMHRDMAAQCFILPEDEVTKALRQTAKGMFVFAQFYGDYYLKCAKNIWEEIGKRGLTTGDGLGIKEHLRKHGVKRPGKFNPKNDPLPGSYELHIQEVESHFWNERFPVYNQWRKDWYAAYLENNEFDTLTGFHIEGVYTRNEVINLPVQGSAFHCLLWSLIRIQKILKKRKMKAMIIGQIHDSIVADVPENEISDYLAIVNQVMTEDIRKEWPWIVVPLEIEAEVTPIGGSWYEKKEVEIPKGRTHVA